MTREEKLAEAKRLYKTANADQRYVLESLFPELAESEDDRIRKAIIAYINYEQHCGVSNADMIAWLEKQGEQTHVELGHSEVTKTSDQELEPKFKVGVWIVNTNTRLIWQITCIRNSLYYIRDINGNEGYETYDGLRDNYRLWTIQDAKDGDVLMTTKARNCPFIYRKTDYNNNLAYYYAGVDGDGDFCEGCLKRTMYHFGSVSNVVPATKEQSEMLFSKIKEAGYEWDAEKKELKKVEPKMLDADEVIEWIESNSSMFWESPCNPSRIVELFKEDFEL